MPRAIMVVYTNAIDESLTEEFNLWYDETHLDELVRFAGVTAATRYELVDVSVLRGSESPPHRYLAIYDVEADDLEAVAEDLNRASRGWKMSDTLDLPGVKANFYRPIAYRAAD